MSMDYNLLRNTGKLIYAYITNALLECKILVNGGGRGIRTPDELPHAGFQDQCIQPLCHSSALGMRNATNFENRKFSKLNAVYVQTPQGWQPLCQTEALGMRNATNFENRKFSKLNAVYVQTPQGWQPLCQTEAKSNYI